MPSPSLAEILAWSVADLRAELGQLQSFKCVWDAGSRNWVAEISEFGWSGSSPDERLVLLHAYGWLAMREQPKPHPLWTRQRDLTSAPVKTHSEVADPEDLDPQEIQAVYGELLRRK